MGVGRDSAGRQGAPHALHSTPDDLGVVLVILATSVRFVDERQRQPGSSAAQLRRGGGIQGTGEFAVMGYSYATLDWLSGLGLLPGSRVLDIGSQDLFLSDDRELDRVSIFIEQRGGTPITCQTYPCVITHGV